MTELKKMAVGLSCFERPTLSDWSAAEAQLGTPLPAEYKEIVSEFGTGWFGNLVLVNPAARLAPAHLAGIHECAQHVALLRRGLELPLFPEPGGYLRLGRGTERSDLLWRHQTGGPGDWIWVDWEMERYHPLTVPLGEFLVRSFRRQHTDPTMQEIGTSIWFDDMLGRFFLPV